MSHVSNLYEIRDYKSFPTKGNIQVYYRLKRHFGVMRFRSNPKITVPLSSLGIYISSIFNIIEFFYYRYKKIYFMYSYQAI